MGVEVAKRCNLLCAEGIYQNSINFCCCINCWCYWCNSSTGTAIATLSGAAATSATLGAIGTSVAGAVGVTVAAPAVLGNTIIAVTAWVVVKGVDYLLFSDD